MRKNLKISDEVASAAWRGGLLFTFLVAIVAPQPSFAAPGPPSDSLWHEALNQAQILQAAGLWAADAADSTAGEDGAADAREVVFPTGIFPDDVANVQAAVQRSGTVLLQATDIHGTPTAFNFGPPEASSGSVQLTRDVVIQGHSVGGHMTTIRGGNAPFLGLQPVRSSISGMHFDGPRTAAVLIVRSTGAAISGNRIANVTGFPIAPGLTKAQGIWVESRGDPGTISGELVIDGNVIERVDSEDSHGMVLARFAAEAKVAGNLIRGVNTNGISVWDNMGAVSIEDNVVIPGPGFREQALGKASSSSTDPTAFPAVLPRSGTMS